MNKTPSFDLSNGKCIVSALKNDKTCHCSPKNDPVASYLGNVGKKSWLNLSVVAKTKIFIHTTLRRPWS